jgi:dTDP-4-amino-4,6-dideoxygalactose transaminase
VTLHPRHRIDIGVADLLWGLDACARDRSAEDASRALEGALSSEGSVLVTHSVRSGFDLLLSALALPEGAEVLLSALTSPDMPRLVRAHGLVPVPVDVDPDTLSPTRESLERAWSPRARVLVVAQLFGARADLQTASEFAAERGLLLVDDDAQGFTGPERLVPRDGVAVTFHSFGSIKTATCLGGALARVADPALRSQMRALHARWPVHPSRVYAKKLALYAALLVPREPRAYAVFGALADRFGPGLDRVVMGMTRGFPAADVQGLLSSLRRRPCAANVSLLARRLDAFDGARVARRAEAGERALSTLSPRVEVMGRSQRPRTHWLFAVLLDDPESNIPRLRAAGFDAARGATSIAAVPAPPERPDTVATSAVSVMKRALFVPMYPEISQADRDRLARLLCA